MLEYSKALSYLFAYLLSNYQYNESLFYDLFLANKYQNVKDSPILGVGAFAGRWQAMRAAALRTAEAYWRVSRSSLPNVRVVAAGLEPSSFTDLFDTWADHDHAAEANIAVSETEYV